MLFASLVGSLVTVWALVRLWRPTEEDVRRLRSLRRGQELGFRLSELGALVEMSDDARSGIRVTSEMRVRGREKLAEIDERIADLRRMRTALGDVLAAQRLDPAVPRPVVGALA
ncbi:MerR family DNA-binding protein [Isoptericola rhizosphaerae]|uniref:MerR family DNA-binding protein n=1 Tax=Isoptericola rhizosphaerae TaxID=3377837 RepID=UPI00383A7FDF